MERSSTDTHSIQCCHGSEIHGERCERRSNDVRLTVVNCLEWLNGLVRLVVQGSYDTLFLENPSLREFLAEDLDNLQSKEIENQLNNDAEFVGRIAQDF